MNRSLKSLLVGAVAAGTMIFAGSTFAASLAQVQKTSTLRVAVANEIPYGYMDLSGNAKGVGPDTLKAVAKEMGIKNIKWTTTKFGSLIPGLKADRFDVVAAEMAILPQRCQQIIYSEPDSSYGEGLLVAKGNPKGLHGYKDFVTNGLKVALVSGADQLEMLQKLGVPADQIVTIASNADAISGIATGRFAAYAATGMTAEQLAEKSNGKAQIVEDFTDPVIDGKTVRSWGGFAFSKDSPKLRDAFNKALVKFKKTDAWKNIMLKYGFSHKDVTESYKKTTKQLCSAD